MSMVLADQTILFLESILLGVLLSLFYDFFFVARVLLPPQISPHILLDILYFLLVGLILFDYVLTENHGRMRYFIALGVIIGWTVYHLTISRIVVRCVTWLVRLLGKILSLIIQPFRPLAAKGKQFWNRCRKKAQRKKKEIKYDLQRRRQLLYNKAIKRKGKGKAHEENNESQSS